MLGDQLEQTVALPADDDRRRRPLHRRRFVAGVERAVVATVEREGATAEEPAQHLDRLAQPRQTLARAGHRHPDRLVLGFVPSRADADVEATVADAVEAGQRLGEHGGRTQRLAQHERAEARSGDDPGQRGERDDGVEDALPIGRTAVLGHVEEEVVRHPERVVPGAFGGDGELDHAVPAQRRLTGDRVVVLRERQSDPHRRHSTGMASRRALTLSRCWSACPTCPRAATRPCSTHWPRACGPALLDRHVDADHHRSVFTLAARESATTTGAVRALADAVAEHVDLTAHHGVHPRLGALDVVPFVALDRRTRGDRGRRRAHVRGLDRVRARGSRLPLRRRRSRATHPARRRAATRSSPARPIADPMHRTRVSARSPSARGAAGRGELRARA